MCISKRVLNNSGLLIDLVLAKGLKFPRKVFANLILALT